MKAKFHLVFDEAGIVKATKFAPSLKKGEIAVLVEANIPGTWFRHATPTVIINMNEPIAPSVEISYDPNRVMEPKIDDQSGQ